LKLDKAVIEELMVHPGEAARLDERSTESTTADWLGSKGAKPKDVAREELRSLVDDLKASQERLWASGTHALLLIVQGMDAAGKDGTIKHVMSGVNPQGCEVESFKEPSGEELDHDFLWRYNRSLPERGQIGIFNRSYFEEVLVVRVHPELERPQPGARPPSPESVWPSRFEDINAFEHHLHRSGTRIVKVYLHLSRQEQRRRLLQRLDDPAKRWKFSASDLAERRYWQEYRVAYEEAITATSTAWAPWYVVPADHKYALRALVGGVLVDTIDQLDLRLPEPDDPQLLERARAELLADEG
jgi:PPK2 family polyphosphate:nucleotide phosphotransferase